MNAIASVKTNLAARLAAIVGAANVRDDAATRMLFGQDVYARAAHPPALVATPRSAAELAAVVAAATAAGASVVARGAGMSYTGGYLPTEPGAVMIDITAMNRILAIDEDAMVVTVEAGATWARLHEALSAKGLRTPFWGPLSGLLSTIGGGLSQNNAFFGAGAHGPVADSVVALKVVLADGSILETGSAAIRNGKPFFRHYGPDLTGLFLGDCGALGVKAEATLRLIRKPAVEGYASFSHKTAAEAAAAMSAFSRAGVGAEVFGFDPSLQRVRMKRAGLASDVKALAGVVANQKNVLSGFREAARIAIAGRQFTNEDEYSVHIAVEGRSDAAVADDIAEARRIASLHGGREIENTIPKVVRANPFGPLDAMIGPEGERWAPVHGIVAHPDAPKALAAIKACLASMRGEFDAHGVYTGCLTTTLSTNGFLIEPVFYWPSALDALHRATVEPSTLSRIREFPENDAATAVVAKARRRVAEIFLELGASHFQIGKTYFYREGLKPDAFALLDSIKAALDPQRRVNPGSLGLD
jgi:FAD/FMN-containing dehydrogenase